MAILPLQLARVSLSLRTNITSQSITRTQAGLLSAQNELSTGKRLNAPSDDPGTSAIAIQLQKTLEQRVAYASNLKQAGSQLAEVDTQLGTVTDLLRQAQTLASQNVGSDVTADQRSSAAAVVKSIYNQILSVSNKQALGVYIFGGDRSTEPPFVETASGVKYNGSPTILANQVDESTQLAFQVNGEALFGALSTRVQGTTGLSPSVALDTRLNDIAGAGGNGVARGEFVIGNGSASATINLKHSDTIQNVVDLINGAGVGGVTAAIGADGVSLEVSGGAGDNITITELGGGTTAADLGILQSTGGGAGTPVDGTTLMPNVTKLTTLATLVGGSPLDSTGFRITNGGASADIDLSSATTVEDMLNAINGSGTSVRAEINATGDGINILNATQGSSLTISDIGSGTTATQLGLRTYMPSSPLSELNHGKGVRTVDGTDVHITDSLGNSVEVDLTGANTVQDVLNAINAATTGASVGVTADFGNGGIRLIDSAGGTPAVAALNFSTTLADLGLDVPAVGDTIGGKNVNPVEPDGLFSHLKALMDSFVTNDQQAITKAAEGLTADTDRVVRIRGDVGARVQELEARETRLEDQNVATKALLSGLEDVDYPEAIARFTALQTALQATLQTAGQTLNMSLLDFLG